MDLRNLLEKSRVIKLVDDTLTIAYDPTAVTLAEVGNLTNLQLIAKAVKEWDLLLDGKPVAPTVEEMARLPFSAVAVWDEIATAIYRDMAAFPKAKWKPPRATTSETGAAAAMMNT